MDTAVMSTIKETYDDVRGLLQTASWEVMDEDQRDDVIAKIVVPRWGEVTADGVKLKATAWGKLLGTKATIIDDRVRRLRASDQGQSVRSQGPQPNQRASIRSARASIKKHPELAKSLLSDPVVTQAATQALVEQGNINALSQATAAVAKNRQVERNRKRVTSGGTKAKTSQDPKPQLPDPGVSAFMSVTGLSEALRALVTTFPTEWNGLTDEQRSDEDFVGSCEEALDKIEIAVSNLRAMISGGISDEDLESLLSGGEG